MAAILSLVPGWLLINYFFADTILYPIWIIANLIFGIKLMKDYKSARITVPVVVILWCFVPGVLGGILYFTVALIYWFLIRD